MKALSDESQIAVLAVQFKSLNDTVNKMDGKLDEIKSARYVTQNEMQLAITASQKDILDRVKSINNLLWLIGTPFVLAIVGGIIKLVFIK